MDALAKIFSKYYFPPESETFPAAHFAPKGPSYIPYTSSRIPTLSQPGHHPTDKPGTKRARVPTRGDLQAVTEAIEREVRYESRYLIADAADMGYWTCLRDIWDKVGGERGLAAAAAAATGDERGGSSDRRSEFSHAPSHSPSRQESRARSDRPPSSYRPSGLSSSSEWDRRAYEEKTNPPPPEKHPRLPRPPVTASIGKVDESKRSLKPASGEKKDGEKKKDDKDKEKEKEKGKEKPKSSIASKYRVL
jgi:hypothetical protein